MSKFRRKRKKLSESDHLGLAVLWILTTAIAFALMLAVLNQLLTGEPESTAASAAVPAVSARAAVVMDGNSGQVVYEKKGDERVYPASTTKIMTALLGIEYGQLDREVTVTGEAIGVEGSSIYLVAGEQLSMEDLLYAAMLRSGNDAATAIAMEVGGSVEAFAELMNRRALELGAINTHFVNPTGLYDENHYTTAYDMALIGRAAMQNPTFAKIAGTKSWTATRQEGRDPYFYNKNKVVQQYEGGTGVKIGYTKASGRTLVASSEREGRSVICVVMDAPDWFNDAYRLMDWAYDTQELMTVEKERREKWIDIRLSEAVWTRERNSAPVIWR